MINIIDLVTYVFLFFHRIFIKLLERVLEKRIFFTTDDLSKDHFSSIKIITFMYEPIVYDSLKILNT